MEAEDALPSIKKKYDDRVWESDFDKWIQDKNNVNKPKPHPDPDHWWNTHPELHNIEMSRMTVLRLTQLEDKETLYRQQKIDKFLEMQKQSPQKKNTKSMFKKKK